MEQRDRFDIMVKSKSSQHEIAAYLVKAVLGLRDRENASESVKLFGSGSAIPVVVLVTEIIRARYKGISSIIIFENMEKKVTENGQDTTYSIPAIRIKLTAKPTEEEKLAPGYQAPSEVHEDKHVELFDYVITYVKDLYFWSGRNRSKQNPRQQQKPYDKQDRSDRSDRQQSQSQEYQPKENENSKERRSDNYRERGSFNNYQKKTREDFRRKPDDHEEERPRQDYRSRKPQNNRPRIDYEQKKERTEVREGEIRVRGGNRK